MNGDHNLGAARMLFGDSIIAILLLNEARHRVVEGVFGVSREDANPVTVIAAGNLAGGFHAGATRALGAAVPSVAAMALGAVALKEAAHGVTGETSRNTPYFGALLTFAILGTAFGPALRASYRGAQGSWHGIETVARALGSFLGGPK